MAKRRQLKDGLYFSKQREVELFTSGCTILDCVLGGGWPLGRVANIVGDKSTGKTDLAIEACRNFADGYKGAPIWYAEVEAAFDKSYAEELGLPLDRTDFVSDCFTVEDLFEHLTKCVEDTSQGLYIVDSLDALSDRSELERDIDKGSYGAEKAKKLAQLFRRLVQLLEKSKVCVIIISQVRDNIGVTFGSKQTRAGGRALGFYASQELWLAKKRDLDRTRQGVKRVYGAEIVARCRKNKVGPHGRQCTFPLVSGYGIENLVASIDWLKEVKRLGVLFGGSKASAEKKAKGVLQRVNKMEDDEYFDLDDQAAEAVRKVWEELETAHAPKRRKYR